MLQCHECGAELPGNETCIEQFHALLAAEAINEALGRMHGLTVLTYHLQHPSLTKKPWYQVIGREAMRRIFGQGENWWSVLLEGHPRGVGRRRSAAMIASRKAAGATTMPDWVIAKPIPGELTVRSVGPLSATGQESQVLAWAGSVARHRYLDPDAS